MSLYSARRGGAGRGRIRLGIDTWTDQRPPPEEMSKAGADQALNARQAGPRPPSGQASLANLCSVPSGVVVTTATCIWQAGTAERDGAPRNVPGCDDWSSSALRSRLSARSWAERRSPSRSKPRGSACHLAPVPDVPIGEGRKPAALTGPQGSPKFTLEKGRRREGGRGVFVA